MAVELRALTQDDARSCRNFRCCTVTRKYGAQIIEQQVRTGKALRRATQEGHRFVGWMESDVLIGCAYHEPIPDSISRLGVQARYIRFIALDDAYQGKIANDRHRFSDRLLEAVSRDIRSVAPHTEAVVVRVAEGNDRSLALVDRHGYLPVPEKHAGDPLLIAPLD